MAFTAQELQESIDEISRLQEELEAIDAKYAKAKDNTPADFDTSNVDESEVERLLSLAKEQAEAEGKKRRLQYEQDHPASLSEPSFAGQVKRRRGLMI